MDPEKVELFNQRLQQWISKQGFWFHLRHSLTTSVKGNIAFHLIRIATRALILLAFFALIALAYTYRDLNSASTVLKHEEAFKNFLFATQVKSRGYHHKQNHLEISRIAAEGSEQSFFTSLELKTIKATKGFFDNYLDTWEPGVITIAEANVRLRAGTDTQDCADAFAQSIFSSSHIRDFEVNNANLFWGFSAKNMGSIKDSHLIASRSDDGWNLHFNGGVFNQNWLRDLHIIELKALVSRDSITIHKAIFQYKSATVDLSNLTINCGLNPTLSGIAKIYNMPINHFTPQDMARYIDGTISGELKVFGSTNGTDGIQLKGTFVLDGSDTIHLHSGIPILKVLTVLDHKQGYYELKFHQGSFDIATGSGTMTVSNLDLSTDNNIALKGGFTVRPPTNEEIKAITNLSSTKVDDHKNDSAADNQQINATLSLKQAAIATQKQQTAIRNAASSTIFDKIQLENELRNLEVNEALRLANVLQYNGNVTLSIPSSTFAKYAKLSQLYPRDPISNITHLRIPLQGDIYHLTEKQAEEIYIEGQQ